ncbi:MAG TPA: HAMP domain-containing sensor histidine kinase [Solirubrobacter sp.]|nr:HAMP domain-containing sensor histidine kinase [Solirubrobacter sp.]
MTTALIAALSWVATAALGALHLRARHRLVLVARASHEVRGPLFAAQLGLHGLTAEPARVTAIALELERAARALDDLSAARTGARGASRPEVVDLVALTEAYAPAWRTLATAHGAELRLEPPMIAGAAPGSAEVFADPLRIAQACANLVGNAAEHGGGVVRVRVRATGEIVRIEVADDGPGLPASVSALTASARARHGRRGHGLAIAAAIAEHHGGRLAAAPSDAGARLMLEVPAARAPVVA